MILNNRGGSSSGGGPKRKVNQPSTNAFNGSAIGSHPIANSTVMGTGSVYANDFPPNSYNQNTNNKNYFNETDQFFNDPFQTSQQENQFFQPNQQNGFYDPQPAVSQQQANFQRIPTPPTNNYYNTNNNNNMPFQQQQQQQQQYFNPLQANMNNFLNDPVASMAVKYGSTLADQGKEYVAQNVDRWFSISKLKHYFAVDTTYVFKKLMIILFPFVNRDWSIKYSQTDTAVPPKLDVNAPDMYIPVMAFVTYILMVGISLGTQNKFSPEVLGLQASSALGWLFIEVLVIFVSLQVLNIKSLKTFDIISFCGYKYFGMILCLLGSLLASTDVYHIVLIYMCISLTYFMVRNLKLMILISNVNEDEAKPYENSPQGNKRRIYVLLFISLLQPFFMWFLTRHLVL